MSIEYQLEIEYTKGSKLQHQTFRFRSAEFRSKTYNLIYSEFRDDEVGMDCLEQFDAITVSTYNYDTEGRSGLPMLAQTCQYSSFKIEVLGRLLALVNEHESK